MKRISFLFAFVFSFGFAFSQATFLGNLPYSEDLSDVWGYVDENGNEYALVGVNNAVSVVDVTNPSSPVQLFTTPGPNSIWRDLKTWGDYAYITNETSGGVTIIDLSPLPQSTNLPVTYFTAGGLNSAHNLYIDENGIMYIFGANLGNGGARMYDLTQNPVNPPLVGTYDTYYIHDGMARGDTLYASHINDGFFAVVDVSDKTSPVILGTHTTPSNFTHNAWVSDDGDYLYTTDEVSGAYLGAYDISNPQNIFETDRIRSSPGSGVIPHNTHFINGYLVTAYYRDGLTIHDVQHPHNMVEIERYDSSPMSGNGFNGAWGAYPWLPSGNILVTDIEEGLYIIGMNYFRAAYLEGNVTDSICGTNLNNVTVSFASQSDLTDINGDYALGTKTPGTYSVTFSAPGYTSKTYPNVVLNSGAVTTLNVELYSSNSILVDGVVEDGASNPVQNVEVTLANGTSSYNFTTDSQGEFSRCNVLQGTYVLTAGAWGYETVCQNTNVSSSGNTLMVNLASGYYDDFSLDFGWTVTGNASTGAWTRDIPNGTNYLGTSANPGIDVSGDCGNKAFVTGNNGSQSGDDDIDNGYTILTSPVFNLTSYTNPSVSYSRWFFNAGGNSNPDDTLIVRISNGSTTAVLEKVLPSSSGNSTWLKKQFLVSDYLTPTSNMTISFEAGDYNLGHLVEAGVDEFRVIESVGISELNDRTLTVYPNPSGGEFNIAHAPGSGNLIVTDLSGRLVETVPVSKGETVKFGGNLSAGVYLVTLSVENSPLISTRIIRTSR